MTKTGPAHQQAAVDSVHFPLWRYNPSLPEKKLTLDSQDKSDTVSFAERALSKDCGENRAGPCGRLRRRFATYPPEQAPSAHLKQLVKKVG